MKYLPVFNIVYQRRKKSLNQQFYQSSNQLIYEIA
jgi:hypothetical protein